jgi:hypothetical protein
MSGMEHWRSDENIILYGEGIGNTVQCIPAIRTIAQNCSAVDLWHAFGSYAIDDYLIPYVRKCYRGSEI